MTIVVLVSSGEGKRIPATSDNGIDDFSDLTLLAAAHASASEFETAIGWQEKSVERAVAEQKPIAQKLIALYQGEQPFDPKLLEVEPPPDTAAGTDAGKQDVPSTEAQGEAADGATPTSEPSANRGEPTSP